jgi:hypothetical protein
MPNFLERQLEQLPPKKSTISPTKNGESHLSMNKRGLGALQ